MYQESRAESSESGTVEDYECAARQLLPVGSRGQKKYEADERSPKAINRHLLARRGSAVCSDEH